MNVNDLIEKYETVIRINVGFSGGKVKCDEKRIEKFELENELVRGFIKELKQLSNVEYNRKVKIPQFVADWLKYCDERGRSLYGAMNIHQNEMDKGTKLWLADSSNQLIFAKAYEHGYEAEEKPKYYVKLVEVNNDQNYLNLHVPENETTIGTKKGHSPGSIKTMFTEREIMDIDKRYWPFAILVEEDDIRSY